MKIFESVKICCVSMWIQNVHHFDSYRQAAVFHSSKIDLFSFLLDSCNIQSSPHYSRCGHFFLLSNPFCVQILPDRSKQTKNHTNSGNARAFKCEGLQRTNRGVNIHKQSCQIQPFTYNQLANSLRFYLTHSSTPRFTSWRYDLLTKVKVVFNRSTKHEHGAMEDTSTQSSKVAQSSR